MYTTIEPRLIALLNNDLSSNSYASPPSLDLPPLHDPNILKASGRPLLLEPDTVHRNGKPTPNSNSNLPTQHHSLLIQNEDEDGTHPGGGAKQKPHNAAVDRALGNSSPQSLRKILDDVHEKGPVPSKKRPIPENSKDDFVQLPQPPKKHKAAKQVVPPIIIGLFEPPPQAALFPPIASSSFHDSHGRNSLNTVPMKLRELKGAPTNEIFGDDLAEKGIVAQVVEPKKKKDARPRRKWTEEETNNLLLGVHKHGVGNWTDILDDSTFSFNERSGADLKDRFRTCCPAELRGKQTASAPQFEKRVKSTSSLMSENILIDNNEGFAVPGGDDEKPRKSRAHRRKLEDLAQLGIEGPFRKSLRRERRAFSEEEDSEILLGYNCHGPAWTRIQRDPRFHLQSRQPTDLRDRFRNKYPEKFRADDRSKEPTQASIYSSQSSVQSQTLYAPAPKNDGKLPENKQSSMSLQLQDVDTRPKESLTFYPPSAIHTSSSREGLRIQEMITTSQTPPKNNTLQPQSSLYNNFTFPEQSNLEADAMPFSQAFDWNTITAPFTSTMGEMDISRLLLDESWPEMPVITKKSKQQSFTNINSILSSTNDASGGGNENVFYNMLDDAEVVDASFGFKGEI